MYLLRCDLLLTITFYILIKWVSSLHGAFLTSANIAGFFSRDAEDDVQVSASFPESNPFGRESSGILRSMIADHQ
jgi:hypothetical protein